MYQCDGSFGGRDNAGQAGRRMARALFVGDQSFASKKNQDAQTDGQLGIKSSFIQSSDSIVSI
jgi:hypothetical protein